MKLNLFLPVLKHLAIGPVTNIMHYYEAGAHCLVSLWIFG